MCPRKSSTTLGSVLGYTIPRLHEGKKWYIDFNAFDPDTGTLRRKKYYITRQSSKREMRATAAALIEKLCSRLRNGWTPWALSGNIRGTILLDDILEKYLLSLQTIIRRSTYHSMVSRVNIMREYIQSLAAPPMYAFQYDRSFISDFLDWTVESRNVSARTRNNYRAWCNALAQFMIERNYISENPVTAIRKLKAQKTKRKPLSQQMLHQLFNHLRSTDRHFLLACMMEYYTFIRPNELRHIHIQDISVMDQTVFIPSEVSKNKRDGKVALNPDIIQLMIELRVLERPGHWYLFGRKFMPSPDLAGSDMFNKHWHKVRHHLRWDDNIKFYSLKNSGIRDLGNEAGIVVARDQARHSDISTTNIYLSDMGLSAPEAAKHFRGALTSPEKTPPS